MHLQQRIVVTAGSGPTLQADRAGSGAVCPYCRTQAHNDKAAQRTAFDYRVGTTCKVAGCGALFNCKLREFSGIN